MLPFYVDGPHTNAYRQAVTYEKQHRPYDAAVMRKLAQVPQARWFTGGRPRQVRRDVRQLMDKANGKLPVLVAYNVPNRDCSQYSAGGARIGWPCSESPGSPERIPNRAPKEEEA